MLKLGAIYLLLVLSFAGPPLLLITLPLAIWATMDTINKRHRTVDLAHRLAAEKRNDDVVKYFR